MLLPYVVFVDQDLLPLLIIHLHKLLRCDCEV